MKSLMKAAVIRLVAVASLLVIGCGEGSDSKDGSAPRPTPPVSAVSSGSMSGWTVSEAFPSITIPGGAYDMAYPEDGSDRLFVSSKDGRIFVFENSPDVREVKTFLDIREKVHSRASETGLLSIAFDPGFDRNGRFYVHYNSRSDGTLQSVVSRFRVSAEVGSSADPASELEILRFAQPRSNHNGGKIAFGKDGYLYIGFGDGGRPASNAQDRTNLYGSIIRIDVRASDESAPYSIPSDNPFFNEDGNVRKEIWAYGLRNPWRFAFDRETGDVWAGDVGQDSYEEVDIILRGRNYGWPILEGFSCFRDANCAAENFEPPIAVYENTPGTYVGDCSITGGYVYRGSRLGSLVGMYIYGDYCSGKIWALRHDGRGITSEPELLVDTGLNIASFGEDRNGELYVLTPEGRIYELARK